MPKRDMTSAVEYIRRTIPPGTPLFVDYETRKLLKFYLASNDNRLDTLRFRDQVEEQLGGYRVVVPKEYVWAFRPDKVLGQVAESGWRLGIRTGDPFWIVSVAWLEPSLASRLPAMGNCEVKEFGRISVIKASGCDERQNRHQVV